MIIDMKIEDYIERHLRETMELAEWLNEHPEIGGCEHESSTRITEFLAARGYEIDRNYGGMKYAFKAGQPKRADRTVQEMRKAALICEYDALPDVGHACGHSLITAMSVLAALAIGDAYPYFPLRLDLIGTPDEESVGGKVIMAKNGAFDDYEFALMGHPDNMNAPQIKVLACAGMRVTFHGKAAHASTNPWDGVNALSAAQLFMSAADAMRQHIPPGCQIHGVIEHGGSAPNTVPDLTVLNYYYRANRMNHISLLKERLENCAKGAAIATGCGYGTDHGSSEIYADLSYLQTAVNTAIKVFEALGLPYEEMDEPRGSTDAGNVDLVIPTFHLEIAATDKFISFHTAEFAHAMRGERGMKTLRTGASVLAQYVNALATIPGLLDKIKTEHAEYRKTSNSNPRKHLQ